jgi:hypothetical protein
VGKTRCYGDVNVLVHPNVDVPETKTSRCSGTFTFTSTFKCSSDRFRLAPLGLRESVAIRSNQILSACDLVTT